MSRNAINYSQSDHQRNHSLRFLRWFCPPELYESIEGDLLEQLEADRQELGERKANWRLRWNVLRFFRPGIVLRNSIKFGLINTAMLRNYLTIAFRHIIKNPGYTSINVLGLVTGIASALIILSIVRFELSFDKFHTNSDRIYRVVRVSDIEGEKEYRTGVSYPVPDALRNEISGLEKVTSMLYWGWGGVQVDIPDGNGDLEKKFQENSGFVIAEPSFFDVFDFQGTGFKWIAGNPATALAEPNSVVLTRSMAEKYFPGKEAVGHTIRINRGWDCKITGVISDLPPNTEFPFKLMLSYATLRNDVGENMNNWYGVGDSHQCYLMLPPSMSRDELETQIDRVHAAHVNEDLARSRKYRLQSVYDVHKDQRFGSFNHRTVSDERLWTLGVVGIFLLVVACINYINLATAQSSQRSKEVGIRKTLGGARNGLIMQFMSEAFLMAVIAGLLGLFIAELTVSNFQDLLSVKTGGFLFQDLFLMECLAGIVLLVTMLAGFYPALVISQFSPLAAIRNKLTAGTGGLMLRRLLVVFQFSITQIFVIATFVVMNQMSYFERVDLGFDREAILNIPLPGDENSQKLFVSELQGSSAIEEISLSSTVPSGERRNTAFRDIRRADWDQNQNLVYEMQWVDPDYISLYGIELLAGRNFLSSDSLNRFIVNETLASKLGFATPVDAIGQPVVTILNGPQRGVIVGVIGDFHSKSLKEEVDKIVLTQNPQRYQAASIKLSPTANNQRAISETLAGIEAVWSGIYPESVFDYRFFDQAIQDYYQEERKFSRLFQIFSVVFMIIGCLGLYGLISFVVHKKMKEVAVRKVFGASLINILILISRDYVRLVLVAFLIAAPTAFFFMQRWLNGFTYHTEISWWVLLLPGAMVLLVAMLTVGGQSLKAASINPSRILKDE